MAEALADLPRAERSRVERVWRCFDETGRLQRWPSKRSEQELVLWIIWSMLPDGTRFNEAEFSSLLRAWHDFEDYALLRRDLADLDLVRRTPDGSVYRKVSHDIPDIVRIAAARFP